MAGQSLTKFSYSNCLKQVSHIIDLCQFLLKAVAQFAQAPMGGKWKKQVRMLHKQALRVILSHLSTSP